MAYRSRGLPSFGCNRCRQRKVKCDETKPTCGRCVKAGVDACEYRDPFERTWHLLTPEDGLRKANKGKSKEGSKTKRAAGAATTSRLVSGMPSPETTPSVSPPSSTGSIGSEKLQGVVLDRFFYDWVLDEGAMTHEGDFWMPYLPDMYHASAPGSVLVESVTAVAHANYVKRFGCSTSIEEATDHCGNALTLLNETMAAKSNTATTDEVMVAVILLGIYETLMDSQVSNRGSWIAHVKGASMLLSLRHQNPLDQYITPGISEVIFGHMLYTCLFRGLKPTLPLHIRDTFCSSAEGQKHALLEHVYNAGLLFSEWKAVLDDPFRSSSPATLWDLVKRAMERDQMLEAWSRIVQAEIAYTTRPVQREFVPGWMQNVVEGAWFPRSSHTYVTYESVMMWRFYWNTRLVLNQAILHTIAIAQKTSSIPIPGFINHTQVEHNLLLLVDNLCESSLSPFLQESMARPPLASVEQICSIRGYLLLQILPVVHLCLSQVEIAGMDFTGRIDWLTRMMWFIRSKMGFTKATATIESGIPANAVIQLWGLS